MSEETLPHAEAFFNEQVKQWNGYTIFSQKFSGQDRQSEEYAYQQADFQAVEYMNQNKAKAMEKYDGLIETIQSKDIGSGNFIYEFAYSYERPSRPIDSYRKDITYNGGFRVKSEDVEFILAGTSSSANMNVKFFGIDPECTVSYAGGVKICFPDNTYAGESAVGEMIKINDVKTYTDLNDETGEEQKCFAIDMTLTADAAHMEKIKSNSGNWHALVPITAFLDGGSQDFIVYVPITVK